MNKLLMLTVITIIVIIAAAIFSNLRAPQTEKEKLPFFPELQGKIEAVQKIAIKTADESINLSLIDNVWRIDEFDGYPALPEKVKSTVLGAEDLKINSPKTAMSRLYHRLGVEDVEQEKSRSLLLTLKDENNSALAEMLVGKARRSIAAKSTPGLYVRRPSEEQSYLVDGVLDITATKTDWIERSLFDIPSDAIQQVRIDHPDGDTYTLFKKAKGQQEYAMKNLPKNKRLAPGIMINRFGTILQDMQIRGAYAINSFPDMPAPIRARIRTFDGIMVEVNAFSIDEIPYAMFRFQFDESYLEKEDVDTEKIRAYAEGLDKQVKDRVFEIPGFKYDIMLRRSETLIRDSSRGNIDSLASALNDSQ